MSKNLKHDIIFNLTFIECISLFLNEHNVSKPSNLNLSKCPESRFYRSCRHISTLYFLKMYVYIISFIINNL